MNTVEHIIIMMPTHSRSSIPDIEAIRIKLKEYGDVGWELVQILVQEQLMIFKR